MKKYFMLGLLIAGLLLLFVSPASANGGPHGGFTATTDACAGCHRTHTATGPGLTTATLLCLSCHGAAATGADTDVEDGVYEERDGNAEAPVEGTVNAGLNAGGFNNAYNAVATAFAAVTSEHDLGATQAYGDGANRGVLGAAMATALACESCHSPHGTAGYRLLIDGGATADYDAGAKSYTSEAWGDTGLNTFCASCHSAYHVTRVNSAYDNSDDFAGNADYGADITTYAHQVGMPYNQDANAAASDPEAEAYPVPTAAGAVLCTTCHFAHGSSAAMTALADGPINAGSNLLRIDNRGVCQSCHQK